MNICDNVGNNSKHAKDCIRSIIRRLNNPDPHVVIQAITVSTKKIIHCVHPVPNVYNFSYSTPASTIAEKAFI